MNTIHLKTIADAIKLKKKIVFFTGAGVSVDSDIPTYRGKNGTWKKERHLLSMKDRKQLFSKLKKKYEILETKNPNIFHRTISEWQLHNPNIHIITQNIDNLHQRAGNTNIIELHGNIQHSHCDTCNYQLPTSEINEKKINSCPKCGGFFRLSVVWFNEQIPVDVLNNATKIIEQADIFIAIGTSAQVYPAAGLILYSQDLKKPTYIVNPDTLEMSQYITHHFSVTSQKFISELTKIILA